MQSMDQSMDEAADVLYAVILRGVAAYPNWIVVCGGMHRLHALNHCQVYSPKPHCKVFLCNLLSLSHTIPTHVQCI